MLTFNFVTKQVGSIFDEITHVVNNSSFLKLNCEAEEAKVVKMFDGNLMVALPVEKLGKVVILCLKSDTTGILQIGYQKVYFSIHGNILYLRRAGVFHE